VRLSLIFFGRVKDLYLANVGVKAARSIEFFWTRTHWEMRPPRRRLTLYRCELPAGSAILDPAPQLTLREGNAEGTDNKFRVSGLRPTIRRTVIIWATTLNEL